MTIPPTPPGIHRRLMAILVTTIYGIVDALLPVIKAVGANPTRPWKHRESLTNRFNAILGELLALTARIGPATLSRNPVFPITPPRQKTTRPITLRAAPPVLRSINDRAAAPPLSARQFAKRLAFLLHQLHRLAAEAATTLPGRIHDLAARARAIGGCNALPPQHQSWERAG